MEYWKPSNFRIISSIMGIGCGLRLICLFKLLKLLGKYTLSLLGLGWGNERAPHLELFGCLIIPTSDIY